MESMDVVAGNFGRLADDFMLDIILLKKRDFNNGSLPFLHAHVIELATKAALLNLEGKTLRLNHRIMDMLIHLAITLIELGPLIPSDEAFEKYRNLWLLDRGIDSYDISHIPSPDVLEEWELCYFIENIVDLKYGYTKDLRLVSMLSIVTPKLNQRFKRMFNVLRKQYSNSDATTQLLNRGLQVFGDTDSNRSVLTDIFA
nr:hypothetical protein [Anaerolineae bacterium]